MRIPGERTDDRCAAEFSSLLMGVVSFKSLHAYGPAQISGPSWLDTIDRLFLASEKPMCLTAF